MKTMRSCGVQRLGLAVLVVSAASLVTSPVFAADQTDDKVAGIIGIIKGQTARLNLVNIGDPGIIPPGPCRGTLNFFDATGNLLPANTDVSLEVGQATFTDLNADTVPFRGRLLIRGVAHFPVPTDPTAPNPCTNTRLTLEIIDNKTLQTVALAPEPHLVDPPEPEKHFGMMGITQAEKLQLNVLNLGDGSVTPDPCVATVSFLDASGRDLVDPVVLTLPISGGSGFSDLVASHGIIINDRTGRVEVRGLVSFAPARDPTAPNACAKIRATMELLNGKTGETTVFYGVPDT